jgi:hypothetical protein
VAQALHGALHHVVATGLGEINASCSAASRAHSSVTCCIRYEWPEPGRLQNCAGQLEAFVCALSDEQRAALGFPPRGDAYWTKENVAAVKKRYGSGFKTEL